MTTARCDRTNRHHRNLPEQNISDLANLQRVAVNDSESVSAALATLYDWNEESEFKKPTLRRCTRYRKNSD